MSERTEIRKRRVEQLDLWIQECHETGWMGSLAEFLERSEFAAREAAGPESDAILAEIWPDAYGPDALPEDRRNRLWFLKHVLHCYRLTETTDYHGDHTVVLAEILTPPGGDPLVDGNNEMDNLARFIEEKIREVVTS